jgi:hypothetical protein
LVSNSTDHPLQFVKVLFISIVHSPPFFEMGQCAWGGKAFWFIACSP